jgi:hypothetical protein
MGANRIVEGRSVLAWRTLALATGLDEQFWQKQIRINPASHNAHDDTRRSFLCGR